MQRAKYGGFGWQGSGLVAITYVYFLIFAQFAFLKRLSILGIADVHLKIIMAAMALGGILLSLLAPRLGIWPSPARRLRAGLVASCAAAFLTLLPLSIAGAIAVAFLIGAGLGLLTVTLVTHLRQFVGDRNPLFAVGLGTGTAYLACNFPPFFTSTANVQATTAGVLCLAGIGITFLPAPVLLESVTIQAPRKISLAQLLIAFTALVWLDSAAFFIIQNTPALKAGTWQGTFHLWANGLLHLGAALASALLLRRKGLQPVLMAAFLALGTACLLLLDPGSTLLASVFYPIGVSLYSVALVAYPSLLAPAASIAERGRIAGWIYAIAGWMGSALGIGMGQNLGHVPPIFVVIAGVAVVSPQLIGVIRQRKRELALTGLVILAAFFFDRFVNAVDASPQLTQIERGRHVYISEGCIHCHSQYVRPHSPDELMWGPVESMQELRAQSPLLIGNRRQGPDLSQVGTRRSALWLKAHFYSPAEVSGSSIMPSYGFLFRDGRGDDLVAYLESLHGDNTSEHLVEERQWQLSAEAIAEANPAEGRRLYQRDCANCHSVDGATRRAWLPYFKRAPQDLEKDPNLLSMSSDSTQQRVVRLAKTVKFGIPGTDMPGHEYLSDKDIASLSLWLLQDISQSNQKP